MTPTQPSDPLGKPDPAEVPFGVDLSFFAGSECVGSFHVPPGTYLIGSDPSCHLCISLSNVERMHARLSFSGHRLLIEDLESKGGIFIGGVRLSLPTPVQSGTEVHIGSARMRFHFGQASLDRIISDLADPVLGLQVVREELTQETYQVTGKLAEGGMGVVLKARDQRVHRSVAMKVLHSGNEFSADKLMRFVGEAQLTGQLEHPNIVPVYQLGLLADGQVFYTMKYVRGRTLEDVLEKLRAADPDTCREYPLSALLTVFMKVADALAFAHSRGVVHRDLKPANLMIGAFGEVLIMDWGLAKRLAEETDTSLEQAAPHKADAPTESDGAPLSISSEGRFQTLHGLVVGTPPYLSPEQAKVGAPLDRRSDIHVMGVILYEILALRPPLDFMDPTASLDAIGKGALIPIEERIHLTDLDGTPPPKLTHCPGAKPPEGLIAIVQKAMQHDPALRYQKVEDMQSDILAFQNGFAPSAERAGFLRQLQLLLGRRRREAVLVGCFLVISQLLLAYFLNWIAADRKMLRLSERTLAAKNLELNTANQRLEQIVYQLRNTAERNYRDAATLLQEKRSSQALAQINLALVGVTDSPKMQSRYLIIRGHANTQLGFYTQALEDYRQVAAIDASTLPLADIEADLARALEDGFRPPEGWAWERMGLPVAGPRGKNLPRNQPPVPPADRQRFFEPQAN
jgi:eukaryotic-like serine/threonine-protein kinase